LNTAKLVFSGTAREAAAVSGQRQCRRRAVAGRHRPDKTMIDIWGRSGDDAELPFIESTDSARFTLSIEHPSENRRPQECRAVGDPALRKMHAPLAVGT
jgi:hypothetical protein